MNKKQGQLLIMGENQVMMGKRVQKLILRVGAFVGKKMCYVEQPIKLLFIDLCIELKCNIKFKY